MVERCCWCGNSLALVLRTFATSLPENIDPLLTSLSEQVLQLQSRVWVGCLDVWGDGEFEDCKGWLLKCIAGLGPEIQTITLQIKRPKGIFQSSF